jgi:hypothetical protein
MILMIRKHPNYRWEPGFKPEGVSEVLEDRLVLGGYAVRGFDSLEEYKRSVKSQSKKERAEKPIKDE